jgi:glycosyltransferase involved in cell wall biosynthesis
MTNPHIALFMPSLGGGGAERMMVHLANAFVERGVKVDLVLVRAEGAYLDQVVDQVRIIDLQAARILTAFPKLVQYLRTHRPEAMLSTLTFANVVATWACRWVRHAPRLILREANTVSAISGPDSGWKNRLIPYLIHSFYPWSDRVVAVSEAAADDMVSVTGVHENLVTTIYNPVVTDELFEQAQEPLDHPWFTENGPPVILGVGRLEPQKDFETLIRAFSRLRAEREANLVILGKGGERVALERLIQSLGIDESVQMPGFVDNPFKYMARADVFALSSRFEGLPGALIQALAAGCPVVSTDCPSGPMEILENGRWGTLIPVGDEDALAAAINRVLNSDRKDDEPNEEAITRFRERESVEQYHRLLLN